MAGKAENLQLPSVSNKANFHMTREVFTLGNSSQAERLPVELHDDRAHSRCSTLPHVSPRFQGEDL